MESTPDDRLEPTQFYHAMLAYWAGQRSDDPPAQTLAATKREFRRDPRYSAPFYWAPFVLYGD
jgi:CHAT domain-containing protein